MASETKPDQSLFLKNEKPREYQVIYRVEGEVYSTIMADSAADARFQAQAMLEDDEFGLELDCTTEVYIDSVRKTGPMFLVTRDGKKMQVSHIVAGDHPREPDERGF